MRQAVLPQPVGPQALGVGRRIGEDQDLGPPGQPLQGLHRARRRLDLAAMGAEELVEVPTALLDGQVLHRAGAVDVLEQGETVDPELQPPRFEEGPEAAHEQPQDLVHVDDDQGSLKGNPQRFQ